MSDGGAMAWCRCQRMVKTLKAVLHTWLRRGAATPFKEQELSKGLVHSRKQVNNATTSVVGTFQSTSAGFEPTHANVSDIKKYSSLTPSVDHATTRPRSQRFQKATFYVLEPLPKTQQHRSTSTRRSPFSWCCQALRTSVGAWLAVLGLQSASTGLHRAPQQTTLAAHVSQRTRPPQASAHQHLWRGSVASGLVKPEVAVAGRGLGAFSSPPCPRVPIHPAGPPSYPQL